MPITAPLLELSIVVPVLNEVAGIAAFLRGLAAQRGVVFQVLVCDGGSGDGTLTIVRESLDELPFIVQIVQQGRGRAQQMNAGALAATGEYLLFLHADSCFPDPDALCQALSCLRQAEQRSGDGRIAARFSLGFQHCDRGAALFYYFAECKARLDRPGCTHGDQGFLISRKFFAGVGPFDPSCMIMEDTRFAENVRAGGQWILLPGELVTSARRFEKEGRAVRQVLNMMLMTLNAIGRDDFIREMPGVYEVQSRVGRLRLFPFLDKIQKLIKSLPLQEMTRFWFATGSFVCRNAWQIAFFIDVHRNFRQGISVGHGKTPCLDHFDRCWKAVFSTKPVAVFAACLTFLSFHSVRLLCRLFGW